MVSCIEIEVHSICALSISNPIFNVYINEGANGTGGKIAVIWNWISPFQSNIFWEYFEWKKKHWKEREMIILQRKLKEWAPKAKEKLQKTEKKSEN